MENVLHELIDYLR